MTLFSGPERLAVLASFGRPTRLGSPSELKVSDVARVLQALAAKDADLARSYMDLLQAHYFVIVTTYLEWAAALVSLGGVSTQALHIWKEGLAAAPHGCSAESVECLSKILQELAPDSVQAIRSGAGECPLVQSLHQESRRAFEAAKAAIGASDFAAAPSEFKRYVTAVRSRHDLIGRFVAVYVGRILESQGAARALDMMQAGLESCAVLKGMWSFLSVAAPPDVAVMLAEHLRAHLSGPGREGSVQIVEENDRYRLIFEPCGTGQVMRRVGVPGHAIVPAASAETWGRANEVPVFCAHCAKNELTSFSKLGYLAWVTEFDPDASRPCGWTVYKNPGDIPERYYQRLGLAKPQKR